MEATRSIVSSTDNLDRDTELRLGLPRVPEKSSATTTTTAEMIRVGTKRELEKDEEESRQAPVSKAQVVGWPPVQSYRKNSLQGSKAAAEAAGLYVKVSMDGAPYLRKIDLKVYKGYEELRQALDSMFKCFSVAYNVSRKLQGLTSEYAVAYEDKDGDLMLAGDVPWEMFISSCKRLRIMKGAEARGLESRQ